MNCKYRCQGCGYEFEREQAGPVMECPKCGSRYMDWLNFKKWKRGGERYYP